MTFKELHTKLTHILNMYPGLADCDCVGERRYECDPRGPEEDEWYEWRLLDDIEVCNQTIEDDTLGLREDDTLGLRLKFKNDFENYY